MYSYLLQQQKEGRQLSLLDEFQLDEGVVEEADGKAGDSEHVPAGCLASPDLGQEEQVAEDEPGEDPREGHCSRDLHHKCTHKGSSQRTELLTDLQQSLGSALTSTSLASIGTGPTANTEGGGEEGEEVEQEVGHPNSRKHHTLLAVHLGAVRDDVGADEVELVDQEAGDPSRDVGAEHAGHDVA